MKFTSIEGNGQRLDGGAMFGNAPRALWSRWIKPDEHNRINMSCRGLLIEVEGLRILCETGIGAFFEPHLADRYGVSQPERHLLRDNLADAGFPHTEIDYVILSHLHFDHAGGLLTSFAEGADQLLFPRAQYVVGQQAWQRALKPHPRDKASFIPGLTDKLQASKRLCILKSGEVPDDLEGLVEFIETGGHTPGQLHSLWLAPKHNVFFCGDLMPGRAWVNLPITMGYDRYPEQLIEEKKSIYDRAVPEKWFLFYTHDPDYVGSFVQQNKKGRFEATGGIKHLEQHEF